MEALFVWWVVRLSFKWISISSRFRNSSGYVFFNDLFTHFHDFWSHFWVVILVTPKHELERKREWCCGVKFFRSNFQIEWEQCLDKNSLWAISLWFFLFFYILHRIFFLNEFPNPFKAHGRRSFLSEPNFWFDLVVFLVHMRYFDIDVQFFYLIFFGNDFSNSLSPF